MTTPRRGVEHYRAGPHLPDGPRGAAHEAGDPALGESVPRCRTCGMPEAAVGVHRFRERLEINGVTYAVCLGCILRSNPRPIADPMDVSQTA